MSTIKEYHKNVYEIFRKPLLSERTLYSFKK